MSTELATSDGAIANIAQLPSDLAILKLENETISSLAAARPRDHGSIKRDLVSQLEHYPSFAKAAIYNKPVGKDPQTGQMRFARGLSIRAAEAIAECYGFCRVRTDVTPIGDDAAKVEATFTDYQKGRIWQDGGIVSKYYKDRNGRTTKTPDDRFYNVVVKAELSKRVREVILRSVPPGLRSELMECAERKIDQLLDDGTVQKMVGKFSSKGVTLEMLEKRIGRTTQMGWTADDRRDLLGLWNAIEEGETTVAEAFGDITAPAADASATPPTVAMTDLTNPKAAPEEPAAPSSAAPTEDEQLQIRLRELFEGMTDPAAIDELAGIEAAKETDPRRKLLIATAAEKQKEQCGGKPKGKKQGTIYQ